MFTGFATLKGGLKPFISLKRTINMNMNKCINVKSLGTFYSIEGNSSKKRMKLRTYLKFLVKNFVSHPWWSFENYTLQKVKSS